MLHNNNQAKLDVEKALADIKTEETSKPDELVSGHPSSQAILLAKKRQDRWREGKDLHAFILTQDNPDHNEFDEFIAQLKGTARLLKPGTRIVLNVFTTYVDKEFDKDMHEQGRTECAHWTPIDLLVEKDGGISSVILDASDTFGHRRMHDRLQKMFPDQAHYIYRADTIEVNKVTKDRRIQTQKIGCRVFSIEHIKQLTQIDAKELRQELSKIADKETGIYTAGKIEPDSHLVRFLRGMQTVTGMKALTPEVKRSPFNGRKTLEKSMAETVVDGRINQFIVLRSTEYKKKKRKYVEILNSGELQMIMENRAGFMYLHNPILFTFSEAMTSTSRESLDAMLAALKQKSEELNIDPYIAGLIDAGLSDESLKSKILFRLESAFLRLENKGENVKREQLTAILNEVVKLLKPTQYSQQKDYLSTDPLFENKPGRSSQPERNVASRANSPVASPSLAKFSAVGNSNNGAKVENTPVAPPKITFNL